MIPSGVLPASITPFDAKGEIDLDSFAKLLAFFKAAKCAGVVIAGTNGEGPSLSAIEKRDFVRRAVELADDLPVILGIATPSLHEATWLASQAGKAQAAGVLLMPPGYFRHASESGTIEFLKAVADAATCPVIAYNFPKYTGFTFTEPIIQELAAHPNIAGFKDSSGDPENLPMFKNAAQEKLHFVGDETLLLDPIKNKWSGSISGAANLIAPFLSKIVEQFKNNQIDQAEELFKVTLPAIKAIRSSPQPTSNKSVLADWNVISIPNPRLPLLSTDTQQLQSELKAHLGIDQNNLALL